MLTEILSAVSHAGEGRRRWFSNTNMDLFLWQGQTDKILGFQFCYDKERQERMFSWFADSGYLHGYIDDGEASPKRNMSPILLVDATPYNHNLVSGFCANAINIDAQITDCVTQHLNQFLKLSTQSEATENTDHNSLL